MPDIPQKINFCPITPECSKHMLYIDVPLEDVKPENVFAITRDGIIPHVCTIKNASAKPGYVYLSEWYNTRTRRTRYMGPFRTRAQSEKSPKDDKLDANRRGSFYNEWELKQVYVAKPVWELAP